MDPIPRTPINNDLRILGKRQERHLLFDPQRLLSCEVILCCVFAASHDDFAGADGFDDFELGEHREGCVDFV